MERSEQLNELAKALAEAQAKFPSITKNEEGKIEGTSKQSGSEYKFSYKYADLPAVVEAVRPILGDHGLSVSQFIGVTDSGSDALSTVLMHSSGQWMSESMRLYLKKQDAQGQGSAITYARRYSFMAVLGLVADEDDDGNAASQPQQQTRNNSGGNAKRSGGAAASSASQAIYDALMKRIKSLDSAGLGEQGDEIRKRIADANFPTPFPAGAAKQVDKWLNEAEQGKPF